MAGNTFSVISKELLFCFTCNRTTSYNTSRDLMVLSFGWFLSTFNPSIFFIISEDAPSFLIFAKSSEISSSEILKTPFSQSIFSSNFVMLFKRDFKIEILS
ncbi:MAG: hypothetical protein ACD_79C01359G0001 [uncultured bacterium]|nr:MAG: hypothetical protein ACD_79C01359G0001 [uncultured bacterium]